MAAVRQMGAGRQRLMGAPAVAEPGTTLVRAAVRTRVPAAVATRTAESVAVRPTLARKTAVRQAEADKTVAPRPRIAMGLPRVRRAERRSSIG